MTYREIVNDTVGAVPVAVMLRPPCDAAIVFDRRVYRRALYIGATGGLRMSDLVMYGRQSGSRWRQFTGEAIVGRHAGTKLRVIADPQADGRL